MTREDEGVYIGAIILILMMLALIGRCIIEAAIKVWTA